MKFNLNTLVALIGGFLTQCLIPLTPAYACGTIPPSTLLPIGMVIFLGLLVGISQILR